MDDVYSEFNSLASPKVNIKEYFEEYLSSINASECLQSRKADRSTIMALMGVELGEEEISMLENYCSIDKLTVEGELPKIKHSNRLRKRDIFGPVQPADVDLQTVQFLKGRLKHNIKTANYKYLSEIILNYDKTNETNSNLATPGQDILIFVRVYHPFMPKPKNSSKMFCNTIIKLHHVIAVLGSQTLAQLRDKITCVSDYTISRECSDDLKNARGPMAKDVYTSGFFFIEDTFYNDHRNPQNTDYSKVIIEWAESRPNLGPFKTAVMEETRIDSLILRFGFPWVYKHQGDCEHIIVFSDARLINANDELNVSVYPRIVRLKASHGKYCMICTENISEWITLNHDRVPHNPCYFCNTCFKSYNYVDNKKIGNFEAYAYPRNIEPLKGKIDF